MARKEFNIFTVSFIDLLSGALAAVIILFIIVPKLDRSRIEALKILDKLEIEATEIENIIKELETSIDEVTYNEVIAKIKIHQQNIEELEEQVAEMQERLADCETENETLKTQLAESTESLEKSQQQLQQAQNELNEMKRLQPRGGGGSGAALYGVSPKFAIIIDWRENVDVDLYMKNNSNGQWCYYSQQYTEFARYFEDVQTRQQQNDDRFEMIFQNQIVEGNYDIYIHLYTQTGSAVVKGYVVLNPFAENEQKIEFAEQTITHNPKPTEGGGVKIGTLILTQTNISLN